MKTDFNIILTQQTVSISAQEEVRLF